MWRRSVGPAARVPDLVGLSVRVAQDLALDAGVLAVEHGPAPARSGVVIGQTPGPGRRVRVGTTVWIRVGLDRAEPDDGPGDGGGRGRPWLPHGPRPQSPTGHKPTPR
jgi:beta-lactam-binding protein with PASTA domain